LGDPALKLPECDFTHIVKGEGQIPAAYTLYQNYPNPFNPSTTIKYFIPKTQHVTIKVYDILGREIAVLVNERQQAGEHSLIFNGQNLSSGIYFYRMKTGDFSAIRKSVLTK